MIWINSYEKEAGSDMCKCRISAALHEVDTLPLKDTGGLLEVLLPVQEVHLYMWKKLMVEQKKLTIDDVHKLEAYVDEVIEYYINLDKEKRGINNEM